MNIALLGYGKMGKTIEQLATAKGHEIALKISSQNASDLNTGNMSGVDVAIEFSRPETAFKNISFCLNHGIAVVSGTTAWLDRMPEAKQLCNEKGGAFFYASNFSIGVNLFFALNRHLANMMEDQGQYDVQMEEIHHTQKLDAPSGTAISLANDILAQISRKRQWINEEASTPETLSIISKRIDLVPGTHSVVYQSEIDEIEIKHTAHSREGFARGALLAAEWIIGKQGYFEMSDLLGF